MELRNVQRTIGKTKILHDLSLKVADGSFTSILGPSGCGKSTTLRIMAGLDQPDAGQVFLNGVDVAQRTAAQRNVAMVFQSFALYPHMSVADNIALPLKMRQLTRLQRTPFIGSLVAGGSGKKKAIAEQVANVAHILELEHLLARKPAALSGGQKQRVALGRALVRDPSVFLLDEPLSNLDATLRVQMRSELTDLHKRTGKSFVYVTHDQAEAMSLSDQVIVMMDGRIAQAGKPSELYRQPLRRDVAAFIGNYPINLFDIKADNGRLASPFDRLGISPDFDTAVLGIRPEDLILGDDGPVTAELQRSEYLGNDVMLHAQIADGRPIRALVPAQSALPSEGGTFSLRIDDMHLFSSDTGTRMNSEMERVSA